jgi:pyridoxal 5'-phosphate synthase pdxS subunit
VDGYSSARIFVRRSAGRAAAIVKAVTHFNDPYILAEVSRNLGEPMVGRQISSIPEGELLAGRGW